MKNFIVNNLGVVEFIQVGEELDGVFSGVVVYMDNIFHIKNNEIIKKEDIEKVLNEDDEYKKIINKVNEFFQKIGLAFNKVHKIFTISPKEDIENTKFDKDLFPLFLYGNAEIPKEEKIEYLKNQIAKHNNELMNSIRKLSIFDKNETDRILNLIGLNKNK